MSTLVWMLLAACTEQPIEEPTTVFDDFTCDCLGGARVELWIVDGDGAPMVPTEVIVTGPEGGDVDVRCVQDVCRFRFYSWSDDVDEYKVTVAVISAHTTTTLEIDGSEVEPQHGCECEDWVGHYEVEGP